MHQLFSQVLGQRDLSRAGDLFSLEDTEIESCLSQALDQIKAISCSPDYLTNDNDQAVVEICITRITTAIRETGSIEQHSTALVGLWESCLEHNLTPQGENTEDTPHAKIASDITSCILQNYSCPSVMVLAVPVAVRFLQRGNRELSRNMSSYLSLAAIAKADLLAEHTEAITLSVLGGNHMLLRVLPSVYPRQPDTIHCHLGNLTAMMSQLESPEQQHLIRLIQIVAEQHPLMLSPQVPTLVSYLGDQSLTEALLGALVDVSQASPSSLVSFLPALRIVGQQCPALLGPVAKIHGAVGIISETHAHSSLVYLVSCLGSMEHSFHHTLLLEIRALTDRYPSLLGGCGKDIYRMSNSFTAIARLLGRRLEESTAMHCRVDEACPPSPCASLPGGGRASEQRLQVKIQAFEEKMGEEGVEEEVEEDSPAPQRRYSLSQAVREERREMRFSRSKSLALHAVRSRSINSDTGEDGEGLEPNPDNIISNTLVKLHSENQEAPPTERKLIGDGSMPVSAVLDRGFKEAEKGQSKEKDGETEEQEDADRLFIHLRDNMETIREFCRDMVRQIPIPEQCVIDVVNQEGQPLIEGKLKEKQVRWKFIKRWKTRYFTLAGNQLLFRRGKSKDELDDIPIELSKVQSVKLVAKKRRDRGLPRAFEIFTDSKTYVLKAQDEKHAEEWLQCINVAVAQARERENREATTYL
uniref:ventricular zone-expressed PH domain-containing protein isoform X3 n=1 Tax=Epinephelus lanceolatus TaxID=310571 RepID=UPI001445AB33|nr:ventricular zone-expressed PH domain-containing protein isoform X3 [Epinephelus lanceolatus]